MTTNNMYLYFCKKKLGYSNNSCEIWGTWHDHGSVVGWHQRHTLSPLSVSCLVSNLVWNCFVYHLMTIPQLQMKLALLVCFGYCISCCFKFRILRDDIDFNTIDRDTSISRLHNLFGISNPVLSITWLLHTSPKNLLFCLTIIFSPPSDCPAPLI